MKENTSDPLSNFEALNTPPSWFIRNGMRLMIAVVVILLLTGSIIRYPDTIKATFVLTSALPPQKVVVKSPGNIRILATDGANIKRNSIVAYTDNPADLEDVLHLKKELTVISKRLLAAPPDSIIHVMKLVNGLIVSRSWKLGNLHDKFDGLVNYANKLNVKKTYNAVLSEIASIDKEIGYQHMIGNILQNQKSIADKEYYYSKQQFTIDSSLFAQRVTSQADFNNASKTILNYAKNLEQISNNLVQNRITINQLERNTSMLRLNHLEEFSTIRNEILLSLSALTSAIDEWEDRMCYISKYDGVVSYTREISDKQYMSSGEEIMSIIPDSDSIYGIASMNSQGAGKVKTGQKVRVELDGYPRTEYGLVKGEVSKLSLVPVKGIYRVTIHLPEGLMNTSGKLMEYKPELTGKAEIVTNDRRFIDRIFYQFKDLLAN